jgi:hypothetical protein
MTKPEYRPKEGKNVDKLICPLCGKPIKGAIYSYFDKKTHKRDPICGDCNVQLV